MSMSPVVSTNPVPQILAPQIEELTLDQILDAALDEFDGEKASIAAHLTRAPHGLMQLPTELQSRIVFSSDSKAAATLYSTCKYFRKFSQDQERQKTLLGSHFPFFKPLLDGIDQVLTDRSNYERLRAAYCRKPAAVCIGTIPTRQDFEPYYMQFSPDNTKLLVAMENLHEPGLINLYDLNTGRFVWSLPERRKVTAMEIAPDNKKALIALEDNIDVVNLVDIETGQILESLSEHSSAIYKTGISPDGKNAYTNSSNHILKFWDLTTGDCLRTFYGPIYEGPTYGEFEYSQLQQFSQDGTRAISALGNGDLLFWDLETTQVIQILKGHPKSTNYYISIPVKISQDNTTAISCAGDELRIWDLETGLCKKVFSLKDLVDGNDRSIRYMDVTSDRKRAILEIFLSEVPDSEITFLNLETGEKTVLIKEKYSFPRKKRFTMFSNGTGFISESEGNIKFWDLCRLPEERLTALANSCLVKAAHLNEEFRALPQFVQDELSMIPDDKISFEEGVNIYNAAKVSLPTIQGFLEQALEELEGPKQSQLAPMLISEAMARINNLSPSIRDVVFKHFRQIQLENGRSEAYNSPQEFANRIQDGSLIREGIEAIARTVVEYRAKLPDRYSIAARSLQEKRRFN